MKNLLKCFLMMSLVFFLAACGGSSSSNTNDAKKDEEATSEAEESNETAEESTEEESKEEKKETTSWEVGDSKARVWTDSVGSRWVQMMTPVTNTGEDNLYLSAGTLDLEGSDGSLVDSKSLISVFPTVLQPGETAYYYEETIVENAPDEITIVPHVDVKKATVDCIRLDTSEINISQEEFGGIKMTGRVENNTEEDASLVYIVGQFYDSENNLLAQAFTILDNDLPKGEKIGFSMATFSLPDDIKADMVDHYEVYAYPDQFQF